MRTLPLGQAFLALLVFCAVSPANARDRGQNETFAVSPNLPRNAQVAIAGRAFRLDKKGERAGGFCGNKNGGLSAMRRRAVRSAKS